MGRRVNTGIPPSLLVARLAFQLRTIELQLELAYGAERAARETERANSLLEQLRETL